MYKTKVHNAYNSVGQSGILRRIRRNLDRNKIGEILVTQGCISTFELKSALSKQKSTHEPLGQILIDEYRVSPLRFLGLLFRQRIMRIALAALLLFTSVGVITKKSHAESIKDIAAKISISETFNHQGIDHYPALFGANEKRSTQLKAFTKWRGMFERFDKAINKRSNQKLIQTLKIDLKAHHSASIYEMAQRVNHMMNEKKYILDKDNWGKSDYWATPLEFMERGGDCEDFAIAKYAALRAMGVPEERMRLAIVQDLEKDIPHAVLIVYTESGTMVLDNQIKTMKSTDQIKHYKPIYSINRTAWWLHTPPTHKPENTIVASSQ